MNTMFRLVTVAVLGAMLVLSGCAATRPDPNYTAYLQAATADAQHEALARASIADAAASCNGNETCVVAVAGFAAMSIQGARSGAGLAAPPRQLSGAEKAAVLIRSITPLGTAGINGAVAMHSSDNSRDIALGQYNFLGGVVSSVASSPALSSPSITVGGDYIPGSVGDTVGGDQVGGDQHIGDSAGRDLIGGDQHVGDTIGGDDNSGNSGRIDSPGPFDNSGQCTGVLCQGEGDTNPPPADPDTGG